MTRNPSGLPPDYAIRHGRNVGDSGMILWAELAAREGLGGTKFEVAVKDLQR
jgi:hypothetical protein